jgi:hypothetical protein
MTRRLYRELHVFHREEARRSNILGPYRKQFTSTKISARRELLHGYTSSTVR